MKHGYDIVLLALLSFLMRVDSVQAQRFVGSVVAGMNAAQIEGDRVHGFLKLGVNVGAGVTLYLNETQSWSVSTELLYVQKGSRKRCGVGYFDTTKYDRCMFMDVKNGAVFNPRMKCNISLDYVQIPVLFRYEDLKSGCSMGLGLSWSRLVRAKEIYNGFARTTNVRSKTYHTSDWSVLAEVNVRLYKNLSFNVRYEYSLVPIRKMNYVYVLSSSTDNNGNPVPQDVKRETLPFYNHLISFRLIYFINEKFVPNTHLNRKGKLIGTKWKRVIPNYP